MQTSRIVEPKHLVVVDASCGDVIRFARSVVDARNVALCRCQHKHGKHNIGDNKFRFFRYKFL